MNNKAVLLIIALAFSLCSACGGASQKKPAIQPSLTPPLEYRQEVNGPNNPGSLFAASDEDPLFSDARARRVGDIVLVKLVESTKAQNKAETSSSKDGRNNYQVNSMFGKSKTGILPFIALGPQAAVGAPLFNTAQGNDLTGSGTTKRENYVTTSMAARVTRVMPGGLLQIEGARQIRVNEETEYMVVRGVVRAKDVDADNSVFSTQLADATIEYYGRGVLSDKQKPGWFSRAMDNVWPF